MRAGGCNVKVFEHWASRVLMLGLPVGRVEEVGRATKGQILRRELVEILTPGTATRDGLLPPTANAPLLCVVQGQGGPDAFGVCVLDAVTARISHGSFVDDAHRTMLRTLIQSLHPSEFVYERGAISRPTIKMLRGCQRPKPFAPDAFGTASVSVLRAEPRGATARLAASTPTPARTALSHATCARLVARYLSGGAPDHLAREASNPLATAALMLCVRHLEDLHVAEGLLPSCLFLPLPLPGAPGGAAGGGGEGGGGGAGGSMYLDARAARHLELVQTAEGGVLGSLLHLIDRTETGPGHRTLCDWLLRPSTNAREIAQRHECIDFMREGKGEREGEGNGDGEGEREGVMRSRINGPTQRFRAALSRLPDLDRALARGMRALVGAGSGNQGEGRADKEGVRITEAGREAGIERPPPTPGDITQGAILPVLECLDGMGSAIDAATAFLRSSSQGGRALPALIAGFGDAVARAAVPIAALLPLFSCDDFSDPPETDFAPRQGISQAVDAARNACLLSRARAEEGKGGGDGDGEDGQQAAHVALRAAVGSFLSDVRARVMRARPALLELVRGVAALDALAGLVCALDDLQAQGLPWTRPLLSANQEVRLEGAYHPTLTWRLPPHAIVTNAVTLGPGACVLLTGPNMGGKSTLMRTVALCQVLAQVGMHVPASLARVGIFDRIFTRMGAEDRIAEGVSTFQMELTEVAAMLHHATPTSLLLLDEFGRGTATHDGMALAGAVLKFLITTVGGVTLFATHHHALAKRMEQRPEVHTAHMACEVGGGGQGGYERGGGVPEVTCLYRLAPGICPSSFGVSVAALAGIPDEVLARIPKGSL